MPMSTVSPGDQIRSTDHNSIVNAISGDAGETLVVFYKGVDIASANALTLADDGNYWDITGTTSITSLSSKPAGTVVKLHFDGALTIVHDGTNLFLSGGLSYTTSANDEFEFVSLGSGQWRETSRSMSAVTVTVASTFGGTPSLAFGTGNTGGTGSVFIRRNAVIAMFDTTAARSLAFGDVGTAGNVGSAAGGGGFVAARDHGHAMPGNAIVASVGNVLAVASTNGNLTWVAQNFVNPMTSIGDLIVGGTAGAVSRFAIVPSTGNIISVASTNGNLAWGAHSAGTSVVITTAESGTQFTTSSTSFVDITSLSITTSASVASTSPVEYSLTGTVQTDALLTATYQILNDTDTVVIKHFPFRPAAGGTQESMHLSRVVTQGTGTKTVKAQMKVASGNGYVGSGTTDFHTLTGRVFN